MAIAYASCMIFVAALYHLPPRVLPVVQLAEGGRVGLVHHNSNGTDDLGIMQINTRWVAPISRFTHLPINVVYSNLLNNPCYNISAAGAIIRLYLKETRGDLMRAIGDYHSHTIAFNQSYQQRVLYLAQQLFRP